MTALADMTAAGTRILDLLTISEAALEIGCPSRTRLADEGELVRVKLGTLTRITPESVAAYNQRMIDDNGRERRR